MSNIYILEDDQERIDLFKKYIPNGNYFTTAHDMIKALASLDPIEGRINMLFLDHDLGGEVFVNPSREDCGMEVVRWIEANQPIHIGQIIVHSWNMPAGIEMCTRLSSIDRQYYVRRWPFTEALLIHYFE